MTITQPKNNLCFFFSDKTFKHIQKWSTMHVFIFQMAPISLLYDKIAEGVEFAQIAYTTSFYFNIYISVSLMENFPTSITFSLSCACQISCI